MDSDASSEVRSPGPLAGHTVVDLTKSAAGPYCTMLLGDLGAEVIKVEHPHSGDDIRSWGPPFWGRESAAFLSLNRNKKSLGLDIKSQAGREILWQLVDQADVLVQNLRPGAVNDLGLDYLAVKKRNESIIYCSMSAFGSSGPMRTRPGYDPLLQAFAGLMSITGEPAGTPVRVGTSVMDMGMGMWGTIGILAALMRRNATGEGDLVETSLFETAIGWVPYQIMGFLATGHVPTRHGTALPILAPYEAFPTSDGLIMIAAGNDKLWRRLCAAIDASNLIDDPRFRDNPSRVRNRAALYDDLCVHLRGAPAASWLRRLAAAGVPCSPIQSIDEVVNHPQTAATEMLRKVAHPTISEYTDVGIPLRWGGSRPRARRTPPDLGADTVDVLTALGLTPSMIHALQNDNVIASASRDAPRSSDYEQDDAQSDPS